MHDDGEETSSSAQDEPNTHDLSDQSSHTTRDRDKAHVPFLIAPLPPAQEQTEARKGSHRTRPTSPPSSLDHATQALATSTHTKAMPGASRFGKAVKYISLFPIAYLSLLAGA